MNSVAIFGLKELPRPKHTGYLYVSYDRAKEGVPLAYFDFYKTTDDEFREILGEVLSKLQSGGSLHLQNYELINFNPAAALIFQDVAAQLVNK